MQRKTLPGRPPAKLSRDIGVVLAFKLVALVLLYLLFFAPAQHIAIDAGRIQALLTGGGPQ